MRYFSRLRLIFAAMVLFSGWAALAPTDALSTTRPVPFLSQAADPNAAALDQHRWPGAERRVVPE